MGEIINFNTTNKHKPFTNDEIRLANIYDVVVSLIIDIEEGKTFSMAQITEQMIEVIEIIREEL